MMKKLASLSIAALMGFLGAAGMLYAQTVYPLIVGNITGNEIMQNLGVGTAQYFTTGQVLGSYAVGTPHGSKTPVLTSCGTAPTISGTDVAGLITTGTGSPTGCTLTFATAYNSTPYCSVDSQTQLAAFAFTLSKTAITITQTGTSSNLISYGCVAAAGG